MPPRLRHRADRAPRMNPGRVDRLACRVEPEHVGAPDQLVQLAVLDQRARIEVRHLGGDAHRPAGGVPLRDRRRSPNVRRARAARICAGIHAGRADRAGAGDQNRCGRAMAIRLLGRLRPGWRSTTQLFEPPKPNELDKVIRTRRSASRADDEIEIAVGVALAQVGIDRQLAVIGSRARRRATSTAPAAAIRWPIELLVELTATSARPVAEHRVDRRALAAVVHVGRRAVRVDVVDVVRRGAGIGERGAHRLDRAVAVGRRIGDAIATTANCRRRQARRRCARRAGAPLPIPRGRQSPRLRRARSRCASRRTGGSRAAACRCRPIPPTAGRSRPARPG